MFFTPAKKSKIIMRYQQLTYEERITFSILMQQGLSVQAIAKELKRHRSTIYRELKCNRCHVTDGAYRPSKAQRRTRARRSRSRRNRHYAEKDFDIFRKLLKQKWSPEQIAGHIRRYRLVERRISHDTIYQYIWRNKAEGGDL